MTGNWEDQPGNRGRFMALWNAGWPTRKIARELGISLSTVWMVRNRCNLQRATNQIEASAYRRKVS